MACPISFIQNIRQICAEFLRRFNFVCQVLFVNEISQVRLKILRSAPCHFRTASSQFVRTKVLSIRKSAFFHLSGYFADILYAPLVPQLMLPKRFKLKPFLPSSSHEVEFYKTHAISVFEKRISVECVEELQHIEYSDESALQMMAPGERTMPDENKRRKLIDEWKKQLKTTAVSFKCRFVQSHVFLFT